jgi:translation initiation factor 4G
MFRGMKMPEAMREFLRNQPRLSKSECGGRGEDAAEDKEDGKGKEKETNESEQTRKQESSDTTTAYDLQAAAAEDEDIKRMIAEFEAKELQWKNNEKAYAAKKAAAVAAEKAKVAQRVRDEDERLRQLEREADEAEEARILRREEERKIRAEKTAAGKRSGTIEKSEV